MVVFRFTHTFSIMVWITQLHVYTCTCINLQCTAHVLFLGKNTVVGKQVKCNICEGFLVLLGFFFPPSAPSRPASSSFVLLGFFFPLSAPWESGLLKGKQVFPSYDVYTHLQSSKLRAAIGHFPHALLERPTVNTRLRNQGPTARTRRC